VVLRSNLIHKIQNMDHLVNLEKLELYDNKIREIKHFSQFVNLK
jgi:singapore isolate B (sub-type 7) whole genome shotgun sequence assembly, scaffold_29